MFVVIIASTVATLAAGAYVTYLVCQDNSGMENIVEETSECRV